MARWLLVAVAGAAITLAAVVVLVDDDDSPAPPTNGSARTVTLDCGTGRAGTKAAFRQLASILGAGDEEQIRSVLVDEPRFGWISAGAAGLDVSVRRDPGTAARVVAAVGGFPIKITSFGNVNEPGHSTDAGFEGRWAGLGPFEGKGAIDCLQGKAIVLSIGVNPT